MQTAQAASNSGTTAGYIDLGNKTQFLRSFSWTVNAGTSTPNSASSSVVLYGCDTATPDVGYAGCAASSRTITGLNSSATTTATSSSLGNLSGYRYLHYVITLFGASADPDVVPYLVSTNAVYDFFNSSGWLLSSPYDSESPANIIVRMMSNLSLPASTTVRFQVRSTPDNAGNPNWSSASSSHWCGASTCAATANDTDFASTYYEATTTGTNIFQMSSVNSDAADDQWLQYRVWLDTADYSTSSMIDEMIVGYTVNERPSVNLTASNLSQNSSGTIDVNFSAGDSDSAGLAITLQYCAQNDQTACQNTGASGWSDVASSSIIHSDFDYSDSQLATTTRDYHLEWLPKSSFPGRFFASSTAATGFKLRVRIDDHEAAKNIAYAVSDGFRLDTRDPDQGAVLIDASQEPAGLTLSASDDSHFLMKIGTSSDILTTSSQLFLGTPWQEYSGTTSIAVNPAVEKVYVVYRDDFDNFSTTSVSIPDKLAVTMIQDTSNILADPKEYRLFVSWRKPSANTSFSKYLIYRSYSATTSPELIATTSNVGVNYYTDTTMASSTNAYYRVALSDEYGNISLLSDVMWGDANGTQDAGEGGGGPGTLNVPPQISNIGTTTVRTTEATIAWDTDTLSDSLVYFTTDSARDFSTTSPGVLTQGVATLVNSDTATPPYGRHRVTLINLKPDTTYYYKVQSVDIRGTAGSMDTTAEGNQILEFTTKPGPVIDPETVSVKPTAVSATITWKTYTDFTTWTEMLSTTKVVYSSRSDMSSSTEITKDGTEIDHSIDITGLTPGAEYFFYVQSDTATRYKSYENGETPYSFKTYSDITAPIIETVPTCQVTISSGSTTPALLIIATTSEPAIYSFDYGLMENAYTASLATTSNFNVDQPTILENLLASTTYHFRYTLADESGNTGTSSDFFCSTGEKLATQEELNNAYKAGQSKGNEEGVAQGRNSVQSSGGTIIIDKTDKAAPVISDIQVGGLTATSARISWVTNEGANGFIKYGTSADYGKFAGFADLFTRHHFVLDNLEPKNKYHYQVQSGDASGNLSSSVDLSFTTPDLTQAELESLASASRAETAADRESLMRNVVQKAMDILQNIAGQVSLGSLENTLISNYDTLDKLAQLIPAPVLGGEPAVDITPTTVTIRWKTDKQANSMVAYAPEGLYAPSKGSRGYLQLVGEPNQSSLDHSVKIVGLKPDSVYHYQLRSKARVGTEASSRDFVFKTKPEALEIISVSTENLSATKAKFSWLTSQEADTQLSYIPYRNGKLSVDEKKLFYDKALTSVHEAVLDGLEAGVVYQLELADTDAKGKRVNRLVPSYSTTKDDLPPEITDIQTESALSQGKDAKVQTIITWMTNEPTICQVKYAKGVIDDENLLNEETVPEAAYSRKHTLVITKFEIGEVYSFRILATDSGGNQSLSKPHIVLTPKQKEGVFELILRTFESTFGWLGKMK